MDTPIALNALPSYVWTVPTTLQCGFPSPAEDHAEQRLDLSSLLIQQQDATFFMRVRGASMRDAGIDDGDLVVIDRSVNAKHGQIVVAVVDGEFTIKRLYKKRNQVRLEAANPTYPNIELKDGQERVMRPSLEGRPLAACRTSALQCDNYNSRSEPT